MTFRPLRLLFVLSMPGALVGLASAGVGCGTKKQPTDDPPPPIDSTELPTPPVHPDNGTPVSAFADAGDLDGKSPLERAQLYYNDGQYWLARLLIEQSALSPSSPKVEAELLAKICQAQGDDRCLDACGQKLGRKIKMLDGGVHEASAAPEHHEPDTVAAHARDLILNGDMANARRILEPRVLGGDAPLEEVRLLGQVCKIQHDKMCMTVCAQKLKASAISTPSSPNE